MKNQEFKEQLKRIEGDFEMIEDNFLQDQHPFEPIELIKKPCKAKKTSVNKSAVNSHLKQLKEDK